MGAEIEPIDTPGNDGVHSPEPREQTGPREIVCPITGFRAVARRPGQRMVTAEEIQEMLEDFP